MAEVDEDPREFLKRQLDRTREYERQAVERLDQLRQAITRYEAALAAFGSGPDAKEPDGENPRLTIKQAVMKILTPLAPRGLSALSILERLRTQFDMTYPRESLSPQLSRLKAEGKVRLEGGIWYAIENQNGPEAQASEPS